MVRWHRLGWRLLWRWRSRGKPGRPFVRYSNENRTHKALGAESPVPHDEERAEVGRLVSVPYLGGPHHRYRLSIAGSARLPGN